MWGRISEIVIACWLALSPFLLEKEETRNLHWMHAWVCAIFIAGFALLSFWRRFEKAHLCSLAAAAWLIAVAFAQPNPPPPLIYQNYAVVGSLLMMFAIVPSRASEPPRRWREFYEQRKERN